MPGTCIVRGTISGRPLHGYSHGPALPNRWAASAWGCRQVPASGRPDRLGCGERAVAARGSRPFSRVPAGGEPLARWPDCLYPVADRLLLAVRLAVSDGHRGLTAAARCVSNTTLHRCRIHFKCTLQAPAGKQGRRVVAAFAGTGLAEQTAEDASERWRHAADGLRPKVSVFLELMDEPRSTDSPARAFRRSVAPGSSMPFRV